MNTFSQIKIKKVIFKNKPAALFSLASTTLSSRLFETQEISIKTNLIPSIYLFFTNPWNFNKNKSSKRRKKIWKIIKLFFGFTGWRCPLKLIDISHVRVRESGGGRNKTIITSKLLNQVLKICIVFFFRFISILCPFLFPFSYFALSNRYLWIFTQQLAIL